MTILGVIRGATSSQCRVGKRAAIYLGVVQSGIRVACKMPIPAILFTWQGGRSAKQKRVISRDARGLVPGMQGDGFASELGGIMEVAVWL